MAKLQSEFSADGLIVVGVNGFNDDREQIAGFVKDYKVNYPVLMEGRKVADKDYFVTGYPTTFWIDRKGTIVRRSTGFDKSEFEKMKAELKKAMAKDG